MKKIKCYYQITPNECGACCIASILDYYGIVVKYEKLKEDLGVGRQGVHFSVMKKYLLEHGFQVSIYETNVDGLLKINVPSIISWKKHHYILLKRVTKKYIEVVDPLYGIIKYEIDDFSKYFTGYVLTPVFVDNREKKSCKQRKYSLKIISKEKFLVGLYIIFLIIEIAQPILIEKIINSSNYSKKNIILFFVICSIVQLYFLNKKTSIVNNIYNEEGREFTKKLLSLSPQFYENHSVGDILFRFDCIKLVSKVRFENILGILGEVFIIILMHIYMIKISGLLSFIVGEIEIIIILIFYLLMRNISNVAKIAMNKENEFNAINTEIFSLLNQINYTNQGLYLYENWKNKFHEVNNQNVRKEKKQNAYMVVQQFFVTVLPLIVLNMGIEMEYSLGEAVAFYSSTCTIINGIISIMNYIFDNILSSIYLERVYDIEEVETEEQGEYILEDRSNLDIVVENITYRYSKYDPDIICGLNLMIEQGKIVAIVGKSGSGKSTILKILAGVYMPNTGIVYFNNYNIYSINKASLYKKIELITADYVLLNQTVLENIICNKREYSMEKIFAIASLIGIHDEIMQLPLGYNTIVGREGIFLSAGQRQRINFVRALLKEPEIIIMDEAMNCLDPVNVDKMLEYIKAKKITCIIATHNMSLVKKADRIYVISDGKVIEKGTHEELLYKKGVYGEMIKKDVGTVYEA